MFIDNEVIRFKNGVTNRSQGDIFNSMKAPDRTIFSEYYNDFLAFNRVITTEPNGTIEGVWNTGTLFGTANQGSILYFGGTQGVGGRLLCQTGANLNDDLSIAYGGRPFAFARDRQAFFKAIINLANVNEPLVNIGVRGGGNDQSPQSGAWWGKPSGVAAFDLNIDQFGTSQALGLTNQPTMVNDDDIELSMYYDGADGLWGGINGNALGKFDLTDQNFPYMDIAGNLIPFIYIQNGNAASERIDLDLIYWATERIQFGISL
jgi:hypothetical protein